MEWRRHNLEFLSTRIQKRSEAKETTSQRLSVYGLELMPCEDQSSRESCHRREMPTY